MDLVTAIDDHRLLIQWANETNGRPFFDENIDDAEYPVTLQLWLPENTELCKIEVDPVSVGSRAGLSALLLGAFVGAMW